jgi:hypothetical protein
MTTTPCPICETDADVLPIPDFDSEAFIVTGPDNAGPGAGLVPPTFGSPVREEGPAAPPRDARRQRLTKTARATTGAGCARPDSDLTARPHLPRELRKLLRAPQMAVRQVSQLVRESNALLG